MDSLIKAVLSLLLVVVLFFSTLFLPTTSLRADEISAATESNPIKIGLNIGQDHPEAGEVMLFKTATAIEGKVNTWKIKLRVETKNKPVNSDTLLIFDHSDSMSWNFAGANLPKPVNGDHPESRIAAAKNSARILIQTLLGNDNKLNPDNKNRMALTIFGLNINDQAGAYTEEFVNDEDSMLNAINNIRPAGNTFTQGAIYVARETLLEKLKNDPEANKIKSVVILTDGGANLSFPFTIPDNHPIIDEYVIRAHYPVPQADGTHVEWGAPRRIINGFRKVYNRGFKYQYTFTPEELKYEILGGGVLPGGAVVSHIAAGEASADNIPNDPEDLFFNYNYSAIDEMRVLEEKNPGIQVYSVGMALTELDKNMNDYIKMLASNDSNYISANDPEELTEAFKKIAGKITQTMQNATVKDILGSGFSYVDDTLLASSGNTAEYDENQRSINWTLDELSEDGEYFYAEIEYEVEINEDILATDPAEKNQDPEHNRYFTNKIATLSFTDSDGNIQTGDFPKPSVDPVFYKVDKKIVDSNGKEIGFDKDDKFTVEISSSTGFADKVILNDLNAYKSGFITSLRDRTVYSFEETAAEPLGLENYEIEYYVNGQKVEPGYFTIPSSATPEEEIPDYSLKVINRRKSEPTSPPTTPPPTTPPPTSPTISIPSSTHSLPRTEIKLPKTVDKPIPATGESTRFSFDLGFILISIAAALLLISKKRH